VLTGDYLAELTMLILWKAKQKDDSSGYAAMFLRQLEEVLEDCLDRGIKIVVNAGGLNPAGLADRVRQLAARLGLTVQVGYITGDDLLPPRGGRPAGGAASGREEPDLDAEGVGDACQVAGPLVTTEAW
jgi:Acyclic terpene utilisation family protein AtuA